MDYCPALDILAIQVSGDQIARQTIANGDQIATRRIEWI